MPTRPEQMRAAASGDGQQVLELLQQQLALYGRLRELAGEQRRSAAGGDASGLLSVLSARQAIVDRLTALEARLGPLRRDWPDIHRGLAPSLRQRADQMVGEVDRLLREIIESDRQDGDMLTARRVRTERALAALGAGQRVNSAYGSAPAPPSRYLDQTDEAP